MRALKLRPKYGSLVDTYVDLCTIWADAFIEIRAQAQENRLQILKIFEAHPAPDAVVPESPDVQIPQNKQPTRMSEPALYKAGAQDPQNKLPMPKPAFDTPDAQDPQHERPMSKPAVHTSAKRHCVSLVHRWKGCPMQIGFSALASTKSVDIFHCRCVQFCLQQIELTQSPCSNREQSPCSNSGLATAYKAAYRDEQTHFKFSIFVRKTSWHIRSKDVLNESDGNSSVRRIPNDAAAKSLARQPEAMQLFELRISVVAFSNVGPSWGLVEMDWDWAF